MQRDRGRNRGRSTALPTSSTVHSVKLKRAVLVGKRGGPCTPIPSWKMSLGDHPLPPYRLKEHSEKLPTISARKLAANLWELQGISKPSSAMKKTSRSYHQTKDRDSGRERSPLQLPAHLSDPSHSPRPQIAASGNSLRRQMAGSLMQQRGSIEKNGGALQTVSPASCSSSLEVGAHDHAITPTSSLDLKLRRRESGYNLTTSTELLKVLNRIWSLEEQHASSMSLVTALRVELDHARTRVQELMQEQRDDRRQIDSLVKRISDEKIVWKSKEQEKIRVAVQSVREELEDERKLRRRSESLHRKLARELAEVKAALAKTLQDFERERKARELMEEFCDELTREIKYDKEEADNLKRESAKVREEVEEERKMLQMVDIWREERVQMKLAEARSEFEEKSAIVDRLRSELEAFLRAKKANYLKNEAQYRKDAREADLLRRQSLESMHLNEAISAPQDAGDDDSADSDLHSIELNRDILDDNNSRCYKWGYTSVGSLEETKGRRSSEQRISFQEETKGQRSCEQRVPFEDQVGSAKSWHGSKAHLLERLKGNHLDSTRVAEEVREKGSQRDFTSGSPWIERNDMRDGLHDRKSKGNDSQDHGKLLNHVSETLARSESVQSECSGIKQDTDYKEDLSNSQTSWRFRSVGSGIDHLLGTGLAPMHSFASPTRQWSHHQASPDPQRSKGSSDWPKGIRENSLKAKLLEARLEGQQARFRSSKGL